MFYHIRHFTLLCLPKGCLLRSNRLSLKKSLEEATEELRRLWKGQLWRESVLDEAVPTRRAGAEQAQSTAADLKADASAAGPLFGGLGGWVIGCLGVWGLSGRGLGDPFLSKMGVWRTLGGDMGDLEGPGGTQGVKSIDFGSHFGSLLRAKIEKKVFKNSTKKQRQFL